jgi:acyl dehydratase
LRHEIIHDIVPHGATPLSGDAWSSSMATVYFEDLNVGDSWSSSEHVVDHDEMLAYGRANDPWPIHVDPEAAAKSPFGGLIASGGYTISLMYRLGREIVNGPDRTWAFLGGFDWHVKFPEPVRSGDRLHERITILETRLSSKPGRGIVRQLIEIINDRERVVLSIESTALLATRPR